MNTSITSTLLALVSDSEFGGIGAILRCFNTRVCRRLGTSRFAFGAGMIATCAVRDVMPD